MKMSRQDGHPDKDALALNFAAAQQAAGSPFGMVPSHGLHGLQPSMMGMMPPNFFAMNQNISSLNPNVAAAMMVDSRQHPSAANTAYSQAAAFHNNMIVPPQHAAVNPAAAAAASVVMKQQQQQEIQPRLVHDAASAPRLIEAPLPKRGPGRPIGSGRGKIKIRQHDLIHASGPRGTDPQTGFPYFSDSPTLTSQDSSEISVPNIHTSSKSPSKPATISASAATAHAQAIFGSGRPEMPPPKWYSASVPLGVDDDRYYLSELHCLLRSEFIEVFGTTEVSVLLTWFDIYIQMFVMICFQKHLFFSTNLSTLLSPTL